MSTRAPGKAELCDDVDNNCNSQVDESLLTQAWYRDADGDTFGTQSDMVQKCKAPAGYVAATATFDCNDADPNVKPSAAELCNGVDDNCVGGIDENFTAEGDGPAPTAAARARTSATARRTPRCATRPRPSATTRTWMGTGRVASAGAAEHLSSSGVLRREGHQPHRLRRPDPYNKMGGTEVCDDRDNNCANGKTDEAAVCNGKGWKSMTMPTAPGRGWKHRGGGGGWLSGLGRREYLGRWPTGPTPARAPSSSSTRSAATSPGTPPGCARVMGLCSWRGTGEAWRCTPRTRPPAPPRTPGARAVGRRRTRPSRGSSASKSGGVDDGLRRELIRARRSPGPGDSNPPAFKFQPEFHGPLPGHPRRIALQAPPGGGRTGWDNPQIDSYDLRHQHPGRPHDHRGALREQLRPSRDLGLGQHPRLRRGKQGQLLKWDGDTTWNFASPDRQHAGGPDQRSRGG